MFSSIHIKLKEEHYLLLVAIFAPVLNFLSGLIIDIYSPSMPSIASEFNVSVMLVKNTISIVILGYAIGASFLGVLFDVIGRKNILLVSLSLLLITTLLAPHCNTITELMFVRLLQGIVVATTSIGCRVLIADHFDGKRLTISVLYVSFSYGLAIAIAPFIGGYLQVKFGWHASFYFLSIWGVVFLFLLVLFIQERFEKPTSYNFKQILIAYWEIITHRTFLSAVMIMAITQMILMFYSIVAPFLVEEQLHLSAIAYGNSALIVGLGYLFGVITNRILLRYLSQKHLMDLGFAIFILSLLLQIIFAISFDLELWCLVLTTFLACYGSGFIIGNVSSTTMKLFPKNIGILVSSQMGLMMFLASCGNFIISYFKITNLYDVFLCFAAFILIKLLFYVKSFRKVFA